MSIERLTLQNIGEAREADLLFRTISQSIGELVSEGVYIPDSCSSSVLAGSPQHPPTHSRHWKSPESGDEEEDVFLLKVREHCDPCSDNLFTFSHEADPLENGDRTIDRYGINNNGLRLYVERWRHADLIATARQRAETGLPVESGSPVEMGIVYSTRHSEAELHRLEKLATILPKAVRELTVGFPNISSAFPE